MGLIIKEIEIQGDKGKVPVKALFDTGSSNSLIKREIADKIATILKLPTPKEFLLGDGEGRIKAEESIVIDIFIKDVVVFYYAIVVDKLAEEFIIGADMMQRWKIKLDLEKEDVIIDEKALVLRL